MGSRGRGAGHRAIIAKGYVNPAQVSVWGWVRTDACVRAPARGTGHTDWFGHARAAVCPCRRATSKQSYGGYLTSKIIELGSGLFDAAVAVAPVTDWRFYDTIYTERYMKTPSNNGENYTASMVHPVAAFGETRFLLVHGTADGTRWRSHGAHTRRCAPTRADVRLTRPHVCAAVWTPPPRPPGPTRAHTSDNVHYQHAAVFASDLVDAGVPFDMFAYTDNDHRINTGPNTQRYLYGQITNYLLGSA